jgi:hypothetical protein
MTRKKQDDRNDPDRPQRTDRHSEDAPAWRPDDEVPANRQEDPHRRDQDDEHEHRERRGS